MAISGGRITEKEGEAKVKFPGWECLAYMKFMGVSGKEIVKEIPN